MIPTKDADFVAYCRFFTEQVRINQERWGVRDELFNPLRRANNQLQDAWLKHTDASTAGPQATKTKTQNVVHARYRIGLMHDHLRGADDRVTPEDLENLGISGRTGQASEPVPHIIVAPNLSVERSDFYTFITVSKEHESGGQRATNRDTRLHPFIVIRYCFIEVDMPLPVNREELPWITNQAVGHSKTIIDATGKAGLKLVVQSAFHNNAGTGPWSEPFEIIVS